jgi:predicted metal-dependent phosphoesterase TrpH
MRIDLHTHSNVSDGTLRPAEVIAEAAAAGLDVVALTDHDGVGGWDEAAQAASTLPLRFVPGVELSCRWYGVTPSVPLHLLAYYVDPADAGLAAEMARVRGARDRRGERIVGLINADGVDITWAEVLEIAEGGTVGRPHIARALVRHGVVDTVSDAFVPSMLGQRWRVPKEDTDVFLALRLVLVAGGVPVFAHPRATKRGAVVPDSLIVEMAGLGLFGLEADHEDHTPEQRDEVRALAADLGLVVTGSSDFHGSNKTVQLGANLTDPAVFEQIVAAARPR